MKILLIVAIIIILVLAVFGYRYYTCKETEGSICGGATQRTAGGQIIISVPQKTKCNFFTGKKCISKLN